MVIIREKKHDSSFFLFEKNCFGIKLAKYGAVWSYGALIRVTFNCDFQSTRLENGKNNFFLHFCSSKSILSLLFAFFLCYFSKDILFRPFYEGDICEDEFD